MQFGEITKGVIKYLLFFFNFLFLVCRKISNKKNLFPFLLLKSMSQLEYKSRAK